MDLLNNAFNRIREFDADVPKEKRVKSELRKVDKSVSSIRKKLVEYQALEYKAFFTSTRGKATLDYTFDPLAEPELDFSDDFVFTDKGKIGTDYHNIYKAYEDYKEIDKSKLEHKRSQIFLLRGKVQKWLREYEQQKRPDRQKYFSIITIEGFLKADLDMIGRYIVATDTFLEIKEDYAVIRKEMLENRVKWKIMEVPDTGDPTRIELIKDANKKAEIERTAFAQKCASLMVKASKWKKDHADESNTFGIQKKRREMIDLIREIKQFADKLDIKFTSLTKASQNILDEKWGLKDYVESDDKTFKKIADLASDMVSFDENLIDYVDRYQTLGDLNMAIGKWRYESIQYNPSSQAATLVKIEQWEKTLNTQFDEISSTITLSKLYKAYEHTFKKYAAKERSKSIRDYPKKLAYAEEILDYINEWEAQYKSLSSVLQDTFNSTWMELVRIRRSVEIGHYFTTAGPEAIRMFRQIVTAYENGDYQNTDVPNEQKSEKVAQARKLLQLIKEWVKHVEEVKGVKEVEDAKKALQVYWEDVLNYMDILLGAKGYTVKGDSTYQRILNEYNLLEVLKQENKTLHGTENEERISIYLNKLINLWNEENPAIIPIKEEPKKKVDEILEKIKKDIDNGYYLKIEVKKEAIEMADSLKERYASTTEDIEARAKQMKAKSIFNLVTSPATTIRKEEDPKLQKYITQQEKLLKKARADMIDKLTFLTSYKQFSQWNDDLTDKIKENERTVGKRAQKSEQLVFASFGELDYDYLRSGKFSNEEIMMMNAVLEDITERALKVLNTNSNNGDIPTGIEEAEAMFLHIPVFLWPDRFVKELSAFKKVHEALLKEEKEELEEELKSELEQEGLATLFSEAGKGTLGDITTLSKALKDANTNSWYVTDEVDTTGKKVKFSGFTDEAQTNPEKFFMNFMTEFDFASDLTSQALTTIETLGDTDKKNKEKRRAATLIAMKTVSGILKDLSVRRTVNNSDFKGSSLAVATVIDVIVSAVEFAQANNEDDISKIPKTTQAQIDKNWKKVETATKSLLTLGVGIAKTIKILDAIPAQVLPVFSIATGLVSVTVNVRQIAKDIVKTSRTIDLQNTALDTGAYDYLAPLDQEINSLEKRIMKRTIDTYGDVVSIAGGIADATVVGAPVGAALKVVAGVIKFGNKIVFTSIDEGMKSYAKSLIKKASSGDRDAMMKIMSNSPRYAKMFIAMGCMEDPPHPIALEFVRQRGLTEHDLKKEHVSAAYIRKFLLADAEETDDHKTKIDKMKDFFTRAGAYFSKVSNRNGFWREGLFDRDYAKLHEVYRHDEIKSLVEKCIWCDNFYNDHPILMKTAMVFPLGQALYGTLKLYEPSREHVKDIHRIFIEHDKKVFKAHSKKHQAYLDKFKDSLTTSIEDKLLEAEVNKIKDERDTLKKELDTLKVLLDLMEKLPDAAKSDDTRR
ncbi:MAG: hypothetical protein AAF598_09505 [Bacteroidota bacterium]